MQLLDRIRTFYKTKQYIEKKKQIEEEEKDSKKKIKDRKSGSS